MAIETVQQYKTSDGQMFAVYENAVYHERRLVLMKVFNVDNFQHRTLSIGTLAENIDKVMDALYKAKVMGDYIHENDIDF